MRYAFMILGKFATGTRRAAIGDGEAEIVGVRSVEEAVETAPKLVEEGIGCIELCGGFGAAAAKRIVEATGNRVPVSYAITLKEQEELCRKIFGHITEPEV